MRNSHDTPSLPVWRSIMFVPAVSNRFVESAFKVPADLLQIDLEDSVGPLQKDEARKRAGSIADRFAAAGRDVSVRVNRPWRMLVRDLEAVVRKSVLAIALPKVPDASFVQSVAEVLAELEREQGMTIGHTRIITMVEDAEGVANMNEIAAAHTRVVGQIIGAEDLAVSMRMAVDLYSVSVSNLLASRGDDSSIRIWDLSGNLSQPKLQIPLKVISDLLNIYPSANVAFRYDTYYFLYLFL